MLNLSRASLDWALNHVLRHGDTDIFPPLFEFKAINSQWDDVANYLVTQDAMAWPVRTFRRCLAPKHRYGFRVSTQLDPLDMLVFTALVYEAGERLEARRVSKADGVAHSFRYMPTAKGDMYDYGYGYETFLQRSKELSEESQWVVVTDIADFYPRLYLHRIENSLQQATGNSSHAKAIAHLIRGWNSAYSYGIPVGSAPSRLIAEVAIDDIDRCLLAEGVRFVRYIDDFRMFCSSFRQAHEHLALLANALFENHGLTLQQQKTRILPSEIFRELHTSTDEATEARERTEWMQIMGETGWYDPIEWDDLTPEQQERISRLNLDHMLSEQLKHDEVDIRLTRFLLRRLAQLGTASSLQATLGGVERLYPVFPDLISYISSIRDLDQNQRNDVGKMLLDLMKESSVLHLEFHGMWLLTLLSGDTDWGLKDSLAILFANHHDPFTQRELLLALGKTGQDGWFRTRKRSVFDFPEWTRRALLAGGGCLPKDERNHWYHSLEPRLDRLELAVVNWARSTY